MLKNCHKRSFLLLPDEPYFSNCCHQGHGNSFNSTEVHFSFTLSKHKQHRSNWWVHGLRDPNSFFLLCCDQMYNFLWKVPRLPLGVYLLVSVKRRKQSQKSEPFPKGSLESFLFLSHRPGWDHMVRHTYKQRQSWAGTLATLAGSHKREAIAEHD